MPTVLPVNIENCRLIERSFPNDDHIYWKVWREYMPYVLLLIVEADFQKE